MKNLGRIFSPSPISSSLALVTMLCLAASTGANAKEAHKAAYKAKEATPVESVANWGGVYFGPQIGYSANSLTTLFSTVTYYSAGGNIPESFSDDPKGIIAGAHVGFNYQINSIVMGLEAAYDSGGSVKDKSIGTLDPNFPEDYFTTTVKRIGSLNARLGYAKDKWLFYALGGYKTATVSMQIISGNPGPGVVARDDDRQDGWTTGLGFEYKITPKMSFGMQYEVSNLDSGQFLTTDSSSLSTAANFNDIELSALTARLSFRFN